MRKQKTLDKFLNLIDEDKGSSGSSSSGAEEVKQQAVPQYWTGVKDRRQLSFKPVRSYDIDSDVKDLLNEKAFKQQLQDSSKAYLFDTDSFKRND